MKYRFKELVDISKLQKLTDELFSATSIPSSIVAMDGEILTASGWQKICTDFHRKHPEIEKECIESDLKIRKKLNKGDSFVIYKCPRGLVDASAPIIIEGEHVANVFSGQVFLSPSDEAMEKYFSDQARKFGFDEAKYLEAFREVPVINKEKFQSGISFLTSLAEIIADLGLSRIREMETLSALKESEERFRSIAEMNGECIWQLDRDGKYSFVSSTVKKIFGYEREEVIGMDFRVFFPESEIERAEKAFSEAISGQPYRLYEFDGVRKDGSVFPMEVSINPVLKEGTIAGVQGIVRDITRNKLAEEALKESEARFRSFMDHFPDPAFIKDKKKRYIYVNRSVLDIWETLPEKFTGTTAREYFNEEDAQKIEHRDRLVLEEHRVIDEEVLIQNRFGENEWRREIRFPIEMPNGDWLIGGITIDINEQIRGKEERQRLIAAIEQTGESLVITSPNGTIEYVNPAFEAITGYTRQEIAGRNPRILRSGYHDESVYKVLWDTIHSGKRWTGRLVNRRKDGTSYTSEYAITPVKNSDGDILNFIWISRDVTGEIALEKRIARAQKMESIGNLASGIAHDFNNILFPILGLAEMLLEDLPAGSMEHENVEEIHKAGKRGRDLVKQILSFGRKGEQKKIPFRIQQVLRDVLKLSRATIPANIEMNQDIQTACGKVLADPTQLHQITMNLITNALHAVEEKGGKIFVGLAETVMSRDDSLTFSMPPGKYAMLTVSDTGCGMTPEVMEKIFEPYFTTKGQGKGTGLGLAVVYGIVREHRGEIRVRSEAGKGTTFDIYLPVVADNDASSLVENEPHIATGNERVLVVDDEAAVLRMVRQVLERLGYRVTAHLRSIDALDVFRANPDGFDLVITDMTMPIMTGERLAEEMMRIEPDIPIIICTGFSERINREKAEAIGVKGLLMKPISKFDIGKMVRSVLDSAKSD
jgi:PAS domain S-box-containing protein